jgi:hypothetical protein
VRFQHPLWEICEKPFHFGIQGKSGLFERSFDIRHLRHFRVLVLELLIAIMFHPLSPSFTLASVAES